MVRVLYAGDSAGVISPVIIASPYEIEVKGFSTHVWGQPLIDGLQAEGDIEVKHLTTWVAQAEYPRTPEEMARFNVVILSDIESDVLVLYPMSEWHKVPMGPNRLQTTKEYVQNGGAFVMMGGWTSYTGKGAKAGYGNTPIADILPVECLPVTDDRVECPEGARVTVLKPDHPMLQGIPPQSWPIFSGYNKTRAKAGAEVLATINGDPFITVWKFGKGRVMAFATDCAPHWGAGFVTWEHYGKFWRQAIRWLAGA